MWKVTELGTFIQRVFGSPEIQMGIQALDGEGDLDDNVGNTGTDSEQAVPVSEDWVEFTGLDIIIDGSTDYGI